MDKTTKIIRNQHEMEHDGVMYLEIKEQKFQNIPGGEPVLEYVLIRMIGEKSHEKIIRNHGEEDDKFINIENEQEFNEFNDKWNKNWKPKLNANAIEIATDGDIKISVDRKNVLKDQKSLM